MLQLQVGRDGKAKKEPSHAASNKKTGPEIAKSEEAAWSYSPATGHLAWLGPSFFFCIFGGGGGISPSPCFVL